MYVIFYILDYFSQSVHTGFIYIFFLCSLQVDVLAKPWLTPEGTINYKILESLLISLVTYIHTHQSCRLSEISRQYSMVYSPATLLDLIGVSVHSADNFIMPIG